MIRKWATLAAAAVVVVAASAAPALPAAAAPPEPASPPKAEQAKATNTIRPEHRDQLLPQGWTHSSDLAWTTSGDADGFHVLAATVSSGYTWHGVADLTVPGVEADQWIGNACLTASGRRLVVVYAPRTFTNRSDLFDRGGFTATVDLKTGEVTRLPIRTSLAYFNPSCGAGESAVLTQLNGQREENLSDQPRTRLTTLDVATGKLGGAEVVEAELTAPVLTPAGIVAAGGSRLVQVKKGGRLVPLVRTAGTPFGMTTDRKGNVLFIDRPDGGARVGYVAPRPGATVRTLAKGPLGDLSVGAGASRQLFITGRPTELQALPDGVKRLDVPAAAELSSEGQLALTRVQRTDQGAMAESTAQATEVGRVAIEARVTGTGRDVSFQVTPRSTTTDPSAALRPDASSADGKRSLDATGSDTEPAEDERWCSVPRNDPRNQVLQPKPRQVEWAIDQAITNSLYVQRPANWKNLGMPAYTPQDLFPPHQLLGGGRVPAQVMLGVVAQESNMWQATRHALPGVTGNPLIGNFYGRDIYNENPDDDWDVRWDEADCGYGVTQLTDGMRRSGHAKPGETLLPYDSQRAVALDFAANVAAGLRVLQDKWNQTRAANLIINNGDPAGLENWFYALWAYNSGLHPDLGTGEPWGLGWANNPANPRYKPDRRPFLEDTYADAAHPQDWPYQEKVLGFAGHPPSLPEGPDISVAGFRAAWWVSVEDRVNVKPPTYLFCDDSNDCHPGELHTPDDPDVVGEPAGPCAHKNAAGKYDLVCWYHQSATWKGPSQLGNEVLRFDPGYAYQEDANTYPPKCDLSGLPSGSLIVDDVPGGTPPIRAGCTNNWTNSGTFGLTFANDSAGRFASKVDFHQIGGGFGGHFWFAHTWAPGDLGGKMKVTGTWALNQAVNGWARVMVHLPEQGAHTRQAAYEVDLGTGFASGKKRVILQRVQRSQWVSLGVFKFAGTPRVRLTNEAYDGTGDEDVAWDAIAVQKLAAKPRHQIVALGDSFSSGEGASSLDGADYYPETDYKEVVNDQVRYQDVCHRSRYAWSRLAVLSDSTSNIGSRSDAWDPSMDYQFLACSGAETENLLPGYTAPDGQPLPTNAWGQSAAYHWGELPQLDRGFLDENTTLVTLSIGGNDARFADVLQFCILNSFQCDTDTYPGDTEPLAATVKQNIEGPVKQSIKTVLREIHKKAPHAQILLMGYPKLFEQTGLFCFSEINDGERTWLNSTALLLATVMGQASTEASAEGIPTYFGDPTVAFAGHGVCGDPEALNKIVLTLTPGENGPLPDYLPESWNRWGLSQQSFHPNKDGTSRYASVMNHVAVDMMGM
ncbi:SGNH/GDSL hydrolase family protein [Micromonospora avicenniae]|uniref:GDSL-like Lipase/Acylhydrolase family protein n=1 Tax=Micromonospora avicenniae TaxID=1198245 RepID=A0A1N6TQV8_9ACTN|nr:SGNH/GDSL hydrolase family protein [Micromonospora avicenniae]SIQ55735.1 GDSL-like Lipase/Acylhydrolase family protein [Micromonospora avicenniae]